MKGHKANEQGRHVPGDNTGGKVEVGDYVGVAYNDRNQFVGITPPFAARSLADACTFTVQVLGACNPHHILITQVVDLGGLVADNTN